MATVSVKYIASSALTISLNSLASGSSVQATAVDNTTNLYDDYLVAATIMTPASGTLATLPVVTLYVSSLMDGTHYTDGCSGTSGTFTAPAQINSPIGNVVGVGGAAQVLSSSLTIYGNMFSVANLFGGQCPSKFVIWATNSTAVTLNSSGNAINITPIQYTAA